MTGTTQHPVAANLADEDTRSFSMKITADMIASNTPVGVAPDPEQISVIDEVYAFAESLRG